MRGQALFAASALAIMMIAQPASAQQYGSYQDEHVARVQQCQQVQGGRTAGGAVIGGVSGAVIGSHAAARGHRSDGAILGAVLGAVVGGAAGHSSAQNSEACDEQVQGSYDPYYGQATQQYPDQYQGGQYQGRPYPGDAYNGQDDNSYSNGDDRDCRMGQETFRDPNGREYSQNVMMCRGDDGVWRPDR
jgi:hypothetical protein